MPSLPSRRSSKRLFLRGLTNEVTEEDLFKYLSCYGTISEVKLLHNYSFVQFESEKDAEVVLETFQKQPLLGKDVIVEFAHPLRKDMRSISSSDSSQKVRFSSPRSSKVRYPVLVMGIPRGIRWQELKDFGRLSGSLVAFCDLDKTRIGRGFIEYFTRDDARQAVLSLDGKRLGGRRVHVVDHQLFRESRNRDRSRSRSPERHSISSRNADYPSRYTETSSFGRNYSPTRPSLVDQNYDYLDGQRFSPLLYPTKSRDQNRDQKGFVNPAFIDSETLENVERASSWARRDHYRVYDGQDRHCFYGRFYDEEGPGYEWNDMPQHQFEDPYQ